jgi:hypothetical protein
LTARQGTLDAAPVNMQPLLFPQPVAQSSTAQRGIFGLRSTKELDHPRTQLVRPPWPSFLGNQSQQATLREGRLRFIK